MLRERFWFGMLEIRHAANFQTLLFQQCFNFFFITWCYIYVLVNKTPATTDLAAQFVNFVYGFGIQNLNRFLCNNPSLKFRHGGLLEKLYILLGIPRYVRSDSDPASRINYTVLQADSPRTHLGTVKKVPDTYWELTR